jgi:ATP phosphoribosyltransferase
MLVYIESRKSVEEITTLLNNPVPFNGADISTQVTYVGGSVEAACALGLSEGIVDLVESGDTMRAAKLIRIATLLSSQAGFSNLNYKY